jgi:hypothetical protein
VGSIGGDAALAAYDLVEACRADAEGFGKCVDAQFQGNKVILFEGFSGVRVA